VVVPETNHLSPRETRVGSSFAVEEWAEDHFPDAIREAPAERAVATLPATNT
jgi:hypothetical protein